MPHGDLKPTDLKSGLKSVERRVCLGPHVKALCFDVRAMSREGRMHTEESINGDSPRKSHAMLTRCRPELKDRGEGDTVEEMPETLQGSQGDMWIVRTGLIMVACHVTWRLKACKLEVGVKISGEKGVPRAPRQSLMRFVLHQVLGGKERNSVRFSCTIDPSKFCKALCYRVLVFRRCQGKEGCTRKKVSAMFPLSRGACDLYSMKVEAKSSNSRIHNLGVEKEVVDALLVSHPIDPNGEVDSNKEKALNPRMKVIFRAIMRFTNHKMGVETLAIRVGSIYTCKQMKGEREEEKREMEAQKKKSTREESREKKREPQGEAIEEEEEARKKGGDRTPTLRQLQCKRRRNASKLSIVRQLPSDRKKGVESQRRV
eukprot:Gb_16199 [translate_table: standard]